MNGVAYLERVTQALGRLPGVGRRSAERMTYRLVADTGGVLAELTRALRDVAEHVRLCERCGGITTAEEMPCRLCTAPDRDGRLVCVVQDPSDIIAIERTGSYRGRYHALMGVLAPMRGEGPEDLRLSALLRRIEAEGFEEIIMALGADVESEATASYLAELLRGRRLRITRLASGIPVGSGVAYADPVTLARAIKNRQPL